MLTLVISYYGAEDDNSDGWIQIAAAQMTSPFSQQPGQVQEQPQELGDIEEEEMTYFDPSTIPDAVPIPEATWVFEVPLNIQNISSEVTRIGVICEAMLFVALTGDKVVLGKGKKRLDLANGSYQEM